MKKSYTKLVMLLLAMVGCMTASAQSDLVELDETMFKAWDGAGADATELDLSDEDNRTFSDGSTFGCEVGYFKNVDGGNVVYGNGNVIYTWYADLTGTKKMYFYGQKGITIRVLYNRQAPEEGDTDAHGHACPEKQVSIGDDGVAVLDVEELGVDELTEEQKEQATAKAAEKKNDVLQKYDEVVEQYGTEDENGEKKITSESIVAGVFNQAGVKDSDGNEVKIDC